MFRRLVLFCSLAMLIATVTAQIEDGPSQLEKVKQKIINISSSDLQAIAKHDNGTIYIDVRSPGEIDAQGGTLSFPRTYNIERGWLEYRAPERIPNKDTPIVVFCGTGQRSPFATQTLLDLGYTNVKNFAAGFISWRNAGLPVEADDTPNSILYRAPQKVIDGVWSAIGRTGPPDYFNSGHNNNLSFIITNKGVVVVNSGSSYLLAKALHTEIKKITDQPVKYVVLENAQGHAMLGSNYWQEQGAKIVAHHLTAQEMEAHGEHSLASTKRVQRDKITGTKLVVPDITFEQKHVIKLGGQTIEVIDLGPSHSPGDIVVWLPQKKLVISGDVAFHERLLPIFEHTDTDGWIETWDAFLALGATTVIPGHGGPTDYAQVTKYTHGYLQYMRSEVGKILDNGGELQDAYTIDQSQYSHLDTFFELAIQNAGRIYREMEFEF